MIAKYFLRTTITLIFICISLNFLWAQDSLVQNKIKTSIYLNFIHYSSIQMSQDEALGTFENIIHAQLNDIHSTPFIQEMSDFPFCIKSIYLKPLNVSNISYFKNEGVLYEYEINNISHCLKLGYRGTDPICEAYDILYDNQNFIQKDIGLIPNLVYRRGVIFFDKKNQQILFISGYLTKSKINNIFNTDNITVKEIVALRYSNFLPKDITIVSNKKVKIVSFMSEYVNLNGIIFQVEYKDNLEIEKLTYKRL